MKKIVVMEDDKNMCTELVQLLKNSGYEDHRHEHETYPGGKSRHSGSHHGTEYSGGRSSPRYSRHGKDHRQRYRHKICHSRNRIEIHLIYIVKSCKTDAGRQKRTDDGRHTGCSSAAESRSETAENPGGNADADELRRQTGQIPQFAEKHRFQQVQYPLLTDRGITRQHVEDDFLHAEIFCYFRRNIGRPQNSFHSGSIESFCLRSENIDVIDHYSLSSFPRSHSSRNSFRLRATSEASLSET